MDGLAPTQRRIGIIGGGFTGTMLAIQICRESMIPREITIFEPRERLGAGVAYSTSDPDHRLNGPIELFVLFPDTPRHFQDWYAARPEPDPDAIARSGFVFPRRSCVADYMGRLVDEHRASNPSGSTINHMQGRAVDIETRIGDVTVVTEDGERAAFDIVFICIAHEKPKLPPQLAAISNDTRVVVDPWDTDAISRLPPESDLLVIGSALTTADVIASLLRRGHAGRITAISRNGLRPREQGKLERMRLFRGEPFDRPAPFLARHAPPHTALEVLQALRADIAEFGAQGREWHVAFDLFREAAPELWRCLPVEERKRALRRLGSFYDVHRYRIAPQNEEIMRAAEEAGQLEFATARLRGAEARPDGLEIVLAPRGAPAGRRHMFGGVINCTGPDANILSSPNPLVRSLVAKGLARPEPTGIGFDVTEDCRPVSASGKPVDVLRILGPMTRGRFADMTAIPQINAQILAVLGASPRDGRPVG